MLGKLEEFVANHAWMTRGLVVLLMLVHVGLAFASSFHFSATSDEPFHLAGGYSYWAYNDYRVQPENGNLPQRLLALPAYLGLARDTIDRNSDIWRDSQLVAVSQQFLYSGGQPHRVVLGSARLVNAILSSMIVLLVFVWSRRVFGVVPALFSASLATICPNMLAHGGLATSDTSAVLMFLLSVMFINDTTKEVSLKNVTCLLLAVSGAFLSKFSAPVIVVFAVVFVLIGLVLYPHQDLRIVRSLQLTGKMSRLATQGTIMVGVALGCYLIIWASFGFRYRGFADDRPGSKFILGSIENVTREKTLVTKVIRTAEKNHVLPEAYLFGAAYVNAMRFRAAYFMGEYSVDGWRLYFPTAFLLKTPLSTLLLGILAFFVVFAFIGQEAAKRFVDQQARDTVVSVVQGILPIAVFAVIVWIGLVLSTFNIGIRHALITYPIMYIFCGALLSKGFTSAFMRGTAGVLCCISVATTAVAFPDYLSYFNMFVPRGQEMEFLVDSNLDWGQELERLAKKLNEPNFRRPGEEVFVDNLGPAEPKAYGIDALPVDAFRPGLYCISATKLKRVDFLRKQWTQEDERQFRISFEFVQAIEGNSGRPEIKRVLAADKSGELANSAVFTFQGLGKQKLYTFLERSSPLARIGKGMFIYRVGREDIVRILFR